MVKIVPWKIFIQVHTVGVFFYVGIFQSDVAVLVMSAIMSEVVMAEIVRSQVGIYTGVSHFKYYSLC